MNDLISSVKEYVYRNARNLELTLWKYFCENGSKKDVLNALTQYQNEDGGFGHAIEADNWNPGSSPVSTEHALKILRMINYFEMDHPIYQGIFRYLESGRDMNEHGWNFTVPDNDNYPHAPWWTYDVKSNEEQYYGITGHFCSLILEYGTPGSDIYMKAQELTDELINEFMNNSDFGDMGLDSYIILIDTLKRLFPNDYDITTLYNILQNKVTNAIEHDTTRWQFYSPRPSNYIKSPDSPLYENNKEIVEAELNYIITTKPDNDVWPITWQWFGMTQYDKEFAISENWWKCLRAIEAVNLLKAFNKI